MACPDSDSDDSHRVLCMLGTTSGSACLKSNTHVNRTESLCGSVDPDRSDVREQLGYVRPSPVIPYSLLRHTHVNIMMLVFLLLLLMFISPLPTSAITYNGTQGATVRNVSVVFVPAVSSDVAAGVVGTASTVGPTSNLIQTIAVDNSDATPSTTTTTNNSNDDDDGNNNGFTNQRDSTAGLPVKMTSVTERTTSNNDNNNNNNKGNDDNDINIGSLKEQAYTSTALTTYASTKTTASPPAQLSLQPSLDILYLGVLLPVDTESKVSIQVVLPALHVARTNIRQQQLLPFVSTIDIEDRDSRSSSTYAPLAAMAMVKENHAHVFFGPVSEEALSPVALYCAKWNIPIISTGGIADAFSNKIEYATLTRMSDNPLQLLDAAVSIFNTFNISVVGMIYTGSSRGAVSSCYHTLLPLFRVMQQKSNMVATELFQEDVAFTPETNFTQLLINASMKCRIIVLCAQPDMVREIMIQAHYLKFDTGDFAFFNVELFSSENETLQPWYRADDDPARNEAAKQAYKALLMVTLRKPTSQDYRKFADDVREVAEDLYKNFTYDGDELNSFVGAFHDSVILYALALNETIAAGGKVTDGKDITQRMKNRTFDGVTGNVSIDANGDRRVDYSLLDLNSKTNRFEVVADYFGSTKEFVPRPGMKIEWPGGRDGPPPDTPECGFDGSWCPPEEPFPDYGIVIIVLGSFLVIVLIAILLIWRHYRLEAELSEMNWRVKWDDILFGGPTQSGGGDMSDRRGRQNRDSASYHSEGSADTIAVHLSDVANRQLYTKTGYFRGAILAIKPIPRTHISITKPLLLDIKKMKDLQNDHLVRFHGVCIDIPNQCILTEYCPKGSLQDVLENDEIKLDWMFRYSIMQDIVRGMTYLHSTDIKSHGHLKSSNCVVDSRFVVKITDFGLHYFKEKEEELEDDTYAIERSKLWSAPELLRMANPPSWGTQKGDVYSFAIICQEIVYRNGVFYLQNLELSPREITEKVRKGIKPIFRPTLEEFYCPNDELAGVIRRCWAEEPADRPDFQVLRTMIKKLNKDGDKGDILDNLLTRMEQYANNLEALVEDRTSDYLQEKKKAEELLYNMLPKSIAHQLIRGEPISAEWYDDVTIYFSDICGFTALSAASTPMQVVDLLNDLYTVFDSIVGNFDVYKVETIGDAYMVVSGLPVRNGNLHAREIARMSMALLDNVFRFKIRHKPNDQLKLRIGIHSGPVCAGVVGLKMPRYCLFGDTVNTASRMESNGSPLRIHVSPFTSEILETFGTFHLEIRGPVEMKGKGVVTTYWLLGEQGSQYNIQQQGNNQPSANPPLLSPTSPPANSPAHSTSASSPSTAAAATLPTSPTTSAPASSKSKSSSVKSPSKNR